MRHSDSPLSSPTSLGALSDDLRLVVDEIAELTTWRILCGAGHESVTGLASRKDAIEAACRLMDNGFDVLGVGTAPAQAALDREQLALIYAIWVRSRYH